MQLVIKIHQSKKSIILEHFSLKRDIEDLFV